ncbi:MAG: PBP1A family penicillin-binding protein [Clostridia bacterium]|nr:PBP1A family penicillin-binding protein [Clostridia bacterium]
MNDNRQTPVTGDVSQTPSPDMSPDKSPDKTPETGAQTPSAAPAAHTGEKTAVQNASTGAHGRIVDNTKNTETPGNVPGKKHYVNAPPKPRETDENRIHWGREILHAGGIMGRVLLRIGSWLLNIVITVGLIGMITGTIVLGVFALWIQNYVDPTIDSTLLTTSQNLTTRLYYMDYSDDPNGVPVELEDQRLHSSENRLWASYQELPQDLVDAFIAVEDHRFWNHSGVDWYATFGATFEWVMGIGSRGGSTITQQLVKNLTQDDDVTIQRKVQEIFRALNLEKQLSKEEIIELYLNTISFGSGTYGIKAAAQRYFNKDLSELNLTECAALAAIPKSPTYYNPYSHPDRNAFRRNEQVLPEMLEYGFITKAEYNLALNKELVLDMQYDEVTGTTTNSWYTDAVIEDVIADLQEELDISYIAASTMLYSEGLSIYTCMDPFVQETLEDVFRDDSNFPTVSSAVKPECAMVVTDPNTGNILGLVGGRGEKTISRGFNLATMAKRSPGSSIKPLTVYAPALDAGLITYGTVIDDTPFTFNEKTNSYGTTTYTAYPANLPAVYKGLTTINSAVERSVNTVAMKVLDLLGTQNSYDFSQKIGLYSITDRYERVDGTTLTDIDYAPLALGALTVGTSVREMTQGYSFLANDGIYTEARTYTKVLDKNGEILIDNQPESSIVTSEQTACIMTKMLQNVVKNGTAKAVTLQKYVDVAGKTGTATDDYDRWFCGYTPYYVGACWFGYTEQRTIGNIATVSPATYIWDVVMTRLHQPLIEAAQSSGRQLDSFELVSGVTTATYCMDSGKLVTNACKHDLRGSRVETGYFTMETAPTTACDTHVLVNYDTVTGAVACEDCPEENVTQVGLVRVENRDFPAQVMVTDAQYVYREWEPEDGITDSRILAYWSALLGEDRYAGISGTSTRAVNSFCTEHYVDHTGDTETETETETDTPPAVTTDPTLPETTPPVTEPITPETTAPETEAPETEPPETEAPTPTEPETEAPATEPPPEVIPPTETEAPADTPTDAPTEPSADASAETEAAA